MKMKNLVFIVASIFIAQTVFGAKMTVYNETGKPVQIFVSYVDPIFKDTSQEMGWITAEGKRVFNTRGATPFISITWSEGGNLYFVDIPSSTTMLMGSFVIRNDGVFALNFDRRGASSNVEQYRTPPVEIQR